MRDTATHRHRQGRADSGSGATQQQGGQPEGGATDDRERCSCPPRPQSGREQTETRTLTSAGGYRFLAIISAVTKPMPPFQPRSGCVRGNDAQSEHERIRHENGALDATRVSDNGNRQRQP
jgi:hypothetical protein